MNTTTTPTTPTTAAKGKAPAPVQEAPAVAPFVSIMLAIPTPTGSEKRDLDLAVAFAKSTGLPVADAEWARDHALSRLPHVGKVTWTGNGTRSVSDAKIVRAYAEAYAAAKKSEPKGSAKVERLANAAREAKRLFIVISALGADKSGSFVLGE